MLDKDGYREYSICGITVKAKLPPGALRYDVIAPDGEHIGILKSIFDKYRNHASFALTILTRSKNIRIS